MGGRSLSLLNNKTHSNGLGCALILNFNPIRFYNRTTSGIIYNLLQTLFGSFKISLYVCNIKQNNYENTYYFH